MGKLARVWLFSALTALACVDKGTSGPKVEGGGDSPSDNAVCGTCQMRAGGETADFGAAPGGGSESCASVEAPLTEEVERAFELDQLRALLARPHVVVAEPRDIPEPQPKLEGPIEITFEFELGEFSYRVPPGDVSDRTPCDTVWAPVKLTAKVGDSLLSFSASGGMFKQRGELYAFMYASGDLATATGSYRPYIGTNGLHAGQIEVPIYVFADQLRGAVIPELLFFENDEQLTNWVERKLPNATNAITALAHLTFPIDGCYDHELTLPLHEASPLLGNRSPQQLRNGVVERIATVTSLPAVWNDARETVVRLGLTDVPDGDACARVNRPLYDGRSSETTLELRMPTIVAVHTDDGKVDTKLDELKVLLAKDDAELRSATLHSFNLDEPRPMLEAWINYSFENGSVATDGYCDFLIEVTPGAGTSRDCVAFPPGGKSDMDVCRYARRM